MKEIELDFFILGGWTEIEKKKLKEQGNIPFLDAPLPDGKQIGVCYVNEKNEVIAVTEKQKVFFPQEPFERVSIGFLQDGKNEEIINHLAFSLEEPKKTRCSISACTIDKFHALRKWFQTIPPDILMQLWEITQEVDDPHEDFNELCRIISNTIRNGNFEM